MKLYQVDAFTKELFRGNPAAVCIQDREIPLDKMLSIAMELNLSETAFARPLENGNFSLRWFTPKAEVDLCGHATLATAHVLFNHIGIPGDTVHLETRSGTLAARKSPGGITLDFPVGNPQPAELPHVILESLGLEPQDIAASMFCKERGKFLVHIRDPEMLEHVEPDFQGMLAHRPDNMIGVIITAKGYGRYDFISRFFAPWVGINEDPVTGSAHTVLAAYWAGILGKTKMKAFQASVRGGEILIEIDGGSFFLTGQAVTVFEGDLVL
ncbi:MAG: PhzF family phenazine biosynthesis protein [Chloroflexi bacterium]|nr:MAG: PhzF family phenazine biosynthesis protein [Chloroflexota bacterium]